MPEYFEDLSRSWRCGDSLKWQIVARWDQLLADTDYTESDLRDRLEEDSLELFTRRRDELTPADARRYLDRIETVWLCHVEQAKARRQKERQAERQQKRAGGSTDPMWEIMDAAVKATDDEFK